jgi:hypothetical protein
MRARARSLLTTPRCRRGALAALAMMAVVGALVPSTLAVGGAAQWEKSPGVLLVHSTRVEIELGLETEERATKYDVEYALAEPDGKAPPANSPAWKLDRQGTTRQDTGTEQVYLGAADPGEPASGAIHLRGLTPNVSYYARFAAKNAANEAAGTEAIAEIPFKTLEVEKPEIARIGEREEAETEFAESEGTDTSAAFNAKIETNGSPTEYAFEYAPAEAGGGRPAEASAVWKLFTSEATGTVTGEYGKVEAKLAGLLPETSYYVRLKAKNGKGGITQTKFTSRPGEVEFFTTPTAKPGAGKVEVRNVTADSAHLTATILARGSKATWVLQWAPTATAKESEWAEVANGDITQEEAEATGYETSISFGAGFTHLSPSTGYYVRLIVKNVYGESASGAEHFETSGAPSAVTFAVHALHGEAWRLLGAVNPNSSPTSLEQTIVVEGATGGSFTLAFDGETTKPIEYNPAAKEKTAEAMREALEALPSGPTVGVDGPNSGPFTVFFFGKDGEVDVSPIAAGTSSLVPSSGKVAVSTLQLGGEAYDTHYRFQYQPVSSGCGEGGWEETPEEDAGSGDALQVVGADIVGLKSGESYCYRVVASSNAPGTSLVDGAVQTLAVPVAPVANGAVGGCPNEAFRTGLSARLPDCRAYEQVTPVDKEGAQELFHYRGGIETDVLVGEGGERVAAEAPVVNLGSGAEAGQSPYFFSREEGKRWQLLAGEPQPETGIYTVHPQVYSGDLSMLALYEEYQTSMFGHSPNIEYKVGRAGGPYTLVASVPREDVADQQEGWVAANGDFSKLVLQTHDHALLGESTGTKSGADLYEYTVKGGLRQLNVEEQGSTIGACGATIVHGEEEGGSDHHASSPHSISADGSRVFFEAVPGHACGAAKDLYMRLNGSETVDIGAYTFMGADAQGTTLLLKNSAGELVGYDTETKTTVSESSSEATAESELRLLGIPIQNNPEAGDSFAHPQYTYFTGRVAGLPGNGIINEGGEEGGEAQQVYRYDDVEHVVQCVSCASPFDPEPKRPSYLNGTTGIPLVNGGLPDYTAASANGDYAFFTTVAALVPEDVDGEIPAINDVFSQSEYVTIGGRTSPSTDVYEWRRDGVDGCVVVDGCLALITDGRGGYLNLLLGTADEGRDVFIYTRSQLVPQDKDTSGDIYDVRVDGGLPEAPPRPVECEGDACSTAPSPPNDVTPSSFTFQGAGNLTPLVEVKPRKNAKPKKSTKRKSKTRPKGKKRSSRRRGKTTQVRGRGER